MSLKLLEEIAGSAIKPFLHRQAMTFDEVDKAVKAWEESERPAGTEPYPTVSPDALVQARYIRGRLDGEEEAKK